MIGTSERQRGKNGSVIGIPRHAHRLGIDGLRLPAPAASPHTFPPWGEGMNFTVRGRVQGKGGRESLFLAHRPGVLPAERPGALLGTKRIVSHCFDTNRAPGRGLVEAPTSSPLGIPSPFGGSQQKSPLEKEDSGEREEARTSSPLGISTPFGGSQPNYVVSVKRLELLTNGLKGRCSAIELHARSGLHSITPPLRRQSSKRSSRSNSSKSTRAVKSRLSGVSETCRLTRRTYTSLSSRSLSKMAPSW